MRTFIRTARGRDTGRLALALAAGTAFGAALTYLLQSPRLRPRGEDSVDDASLLERVRSAMRQVVDDPRAVVVRVHSGTVVLKGPARAEQIAELVACAARVPGVRAVENRLSLNG